MKLILIIGCAAGCLAFADDFADRDKLAGTWESSDGARWVLNTKPDAVHIAEFDHDRKLSEFECNTVGKECAIQEAGKPAKVTMYFNGPMLIVMETRGSSVVKQRFRTEGDGKELTVETIPLAPEGKTETVKLSRSDK